MNRYTRYPRNNENSCLCLQCGWFLWKGLNLITSLTSKQVWSTSQKKRLERKHLRKHIHKHITITDLPKALWGVLTGYQSEKLQLSSKWFRTKKIEMFLCHSKEHHWWSAFQHWSMQPSCAWPPLLLDIIPSLPCQLLWESRFSVIVSFSLSFTPKNFIFPLFFFYSHDTFCNELTLSIFF